MNSREFLSFSAHSRSASRESAGSRHDHGQVIRKSGLRPMISHPSGSPPGRAKAGSASASRGHMQMLHGSIAAAGYCASAAWAYLYPNGKVRRASGPLQRSSEGPPPPWVFCFRRQPSPPPWGCRHTYGPEPCAPALFSSSDRNSRERYPLPGDAEAP